MINVNAAQRAAIEAEAEEQLVLFADSPETRPVNIRAVA